MKELIVSCPNCSAKYNVAKYESGKKFKCKSCGKYLIVPEKPDEDDEGPPMVEEQEEKQAAKPSRAGRRGGTRGRRRPGGARGGTARRSRREEDEEVDDRMPVRLNKGPNWPLILGAGGGLILIFVVGGLAVSNMFERQRKAREAEEAAEQERRDSYKGGLGQAEEAEGDEKGRKHLKYGETEKKDEPAPGEHVGDGKIAELEDEQEAPGQETIRTKWKQADVKDKVKRWRVRKARIKLDSSTTSKAERILNRFKEVFGDPAGEREALEELAGLGKDAIPAALNFLTTDINHMNQDEAMMGSQLFNMIRDKAVEIWNYENEFNYGMFESGKERWNAIIEMKMKCLEEGYDIEEK